MADWALNAEETEILRPDISHLITEDDTPVDIFVKKQQDLLADVLFSGWAGPGDGRRFVCFTNVGMFYSVHKQAVVPDLLLSLDVKQPQEVWEKHHRSYFIWEYGKPPEMVVEVVTSSKEQEMPQMKSLYARLGVAYYIVYDPEQLLGNSQLNVFYRKGASYVFTEETWLPDVGLGLTLWEGTYQGLTAAWLRWTDAENNLIGPSPPEYRGRGEKICFPQSTSPAHR
jgi:Uma2 family endonuclease